MSILTGDNPFADLKEKKGPCWTGYRKVPGKKDYEDGSCVKAEETETEEDTVEESGFTSSDDDAQRQRAQAALHKKTGTKDSSGNIKTQSSIGNRDRYVPNKKRESEKLSDLDRLKALKAKLDARRTQKEEFEVNAIEDTVEEDKKGHFRSTEAGAGMTAKGVAAHKRENPGSKLKTAVTTEPSKLKPGSKAAKRRKSFCARSRGWNGERGKAARRRWNC